MLKKIARTCFSSSIVCDKHYQVKSQLDFWWIQATKELCQEKEEACDKELRKRVEED
jgi:hypothetical protein